MLKTALFDRAINEKCCSVDRGRDICHFFSSPPRKIWQLKSPHPREFAIQGKKNANARESARGWGGGGLSADGIDWCINLRTVSLQVGQVQTVSKFLAVVYLNLEFYWSVCQKKLGEGCDEDAYIPSQDSSQDFGQYSSQDSTQDSTIFRFSAIFTSHKSHDH